VLGKYGYERGLKRQRVWNNLAKIEGMERGKREKECVYVECVCECGRSREGRDAGNERRKVQVTVRWLVGASGRMGGGVE